MDPQVVSLDAQHCLAIATAFIAIIGACASLIAGANGKAESLTKRIHEAAREFRDEKREGDDARCRKLKKQIDYYDQRYRMVQRAQRRLLFTTGVFIVCLATFICLALYGSFQGIRDVTKDATFGPFARYLLAGIGFGVAGGSLVMLHAIFLHFREVWLSYGALHIEMSDCKAGVEPAQQEPAAPAPKSPGRLWAALSSLMPFRRHARP
ncbi:MAG: DUF2721 domain-containing protein [Acidobacteria bacterium]|nr:DUF2721 domain-containing protein [Acidobacteriota bacterium]